MKVIEQYDKDANQMLSEAELSACPGIGAARRHYDTNQDAQISREEIETHLTAIFSQGIGMTPVTCTVIHGSAPLANATVRFIPEPIFDGALKPGTGVTDENGAAIIAISDADLPEEQQNLRSMQPGIYRVEIEHPGIKQPHPPLGCEIDPSKRGGTDPRFRL